MARITFSVVLASAILASTTNAQYTPPDSAALEGVIVERYYVADQSDAADEDGSAQLVPGAVTYRVFLDMKEGYELQILGGFTNHPLTFNTTTTFFNNEDRGETWGDAINDIHLDKNTVAIDSWLAIGAASDAHWGVLKSDDPDGAQDGVMFPNDGGSNGVAGGLLANTSGFDIPLAEADGLMEGDTAPPASTFVGDSPEAFNTGGNAFTSENFGLAVLGDVRCPTPGNKILIGQFTTDGVFSFCLNIWLRIPDSLVCNDPDCRTAIVYYPDLLDADTVGTEGNYRFAFPGLCYSSDAEELDCLGVPGGTALPGSACDDGNADTDNDVYDSGCVCVGEDCLGVLGGSALPGQPCDDGNPDTSGEVWVEGCNCLATGIEEQSNSKITIHPNPTRDLVRVRIEGLNGTNVTLDVKNMLGESVQRHTLGTVSGDRTETLDLSGLSGGTYILDIQTDGRSRMERITKF